MVQLSILASPDACLVAGGGRCSVAGQCRRAAGVPEPAGAALRWRGARRPAGGPAPEGGGERVEDGCVAMGDWVAGNLGKHCVAMSAHLLEGCGHALRVVAAVATMAAQEGEVWGVHRGGREAGGAKLWPGLGGDGEGGGQVEGQGGGGPVPHQTLLQQLCLALLTLL